MLTESKQPSSSSFHFFLFSISHPTPSSMSSISPAHYDPYNNVSYVQLNKVRYGEIERDESEKLENRTRKPSVRKIYLKKNGDGPKNKPKKFIWKKWASPTIKLLVEDAGNFVGLGSEAKFLYDKSGNRIRDESEIRDGETYYVTSGEQFEIFDSDFNVSPRQSRQSYQYNKVPRTGNLSSIERKESRISLNRPPTTRRASWWSTASEDLIDYDYDKYDYRTPTPTKRRSRSAQSLYDNGYYGSVPRPFSAENQSYYRVTSADYRPGSTYRYYDYDRPQSIKNNYPKNTIGIPHSAPAPTKKVKKKNKDIDLLPRRSIIDTRDTRRDMASRHTYPETTPSRRSLSRARSSKSAHINLLSDFDDYDATKKDKDAMSKHKEMMQSWKRSKSGVIYNRRDQTHPDAYIIYVFLNGQGMNCQYINFQKKQLEKGMNYVLEIVARRFNVNPAKLCDLDGKKIHNIQDLMSRGAYVLVPVGQSFRDQWYFLPDNAIDTSSNAEKVRERSAQRDRLLQRREKKQQIKTKSTTGRTKYDLTRSKSMDFKKPSKKSLY